LQNTEADQSSLTPLNQGPYPLYDFTSGGMTHVSEVYPRADNRYRVAGPFVEFNFGLIEIDWEAAPEPLIHLGRRLG
jgi:hypothetical protein